MNQHDPLDGLYAAQAPKESLFQLYGKKVIGGIACSAFVAFIMHLPYIKTVILWLCTAVVMVFGKPATFEKIEGKLDHFVEKGREVAEKHAHPSESLVKKALAPVVAPVKEVVAVKKTVEDVKEKAENGVKTIKDTGEKVVSAIGGVGERAKETVGGLGAGIAGMAAARRKRTKNMLGREAAMRDQLIVHARTRNVQVDESWSTARLAAEVQQAEREWQAKHGPNAQCPNPKCQFAMRISPTVKGERRCPRCGLIFSATTARRLGPPRRHSGTASGDEMNYFATHAGKGVLFIAGAASSSPSRSPSPGSQPSAAPVGRQPSHPRIPGDRS